MVLAMFGEDEDFFSEACAGNKQAIDLAIGLELVESSQGGPGCQDPLLWEEFA